MDGIVAFFLPDAESLRKHSESLTVPVDDYHVTLAYLPDIQDDQVGRLRELVQKFALASKPVVGSFGGVGRFPPHEENDEKETVYVPVDLPGLPAFRQDIVETLRANGFEIAVNHGFTPHMTLGYQDPDSSFSPDLVPQTPVEFRELVLSLADGDQEYSFPMGEGERLAGYLRELLSDAPETIQGEIAVKTCAFARAVDDGREIEKALASSFPFSPAVRSFLVTILKRR